MYLKVFCKWLYTQFKKKKKKNGFYTYIYDLHRVSYVWSK